MKTAVVFGASGTIGSGISQKLAENGYSLCLVGHSRIPSVDLDVPSCYTKCDISDPASVNSVFDLAEERLSVPSLVINACGIALKQQLLADTADEDIQRLLNVNIGGMLNISRAAARILHRNGFGYLIHISSMWGTIGGSCETVYSATKGAMNALVKALAKELAPDNITVNAIAPGLVLSPMNTHLSSDELDSFRADTPLNCFITPEDIARAVLYLSSSPHVTGQILAVDGGIVV